MDTFKVFVYRRRRIRAVFTNGKKPVWVFRDLCIALEVTSPAEAFCLLKDDEKELHNARDLFGDEHRFMCVSEKGLRTMLQLYPNTASALERWMDVLLRTNLQAGANQSTYDQYLSHGQSK